LRCTFVRLTSTTDNEDDTKTETIYILAGIEDISAEANLKKHLAEVQEQKQQDMRVLFEVFSVEPLVFDDIIAGTEFNFDEIKRIMCETGENRLDAEQALTMIFQLIHATKSDAVIVGLETFGEKLHLFESRIKLILEHPVEPKNMHDVLSEVEKLIAEKEKLTTTLQTIVTYRENKKNSDMKPSYLLSNSIHKTCDKLAADLEKAVVFIADDLEIDDLPGDMRRELKGILVQIARNAVYHGIETPVERIAAGKDEAGTISLSIKRIAPTDDGKTLEIKISDDGKGIDFAAVREKALNLGMVRKSDTSDSISESVLTDILFRPGFSTATETSMHAGRGIGLSLVRDRVTVLGGTVEMHTEKGKGTEFVIRL
jgi:two-component system chemotaxis sensor kinase CheA